MANEFWLNLPVKDLNKSKAFFNNIGFTFSDGQGNSPTTAPLLLGRHKIVVMLCEEPTFKSFVNQEISDTTQSCEVLLSVDASSKEEVDAIVEKVLASGGKSNHKPHEMSGFMYGCVFSDLDGHRWNVLHMKF